MSIKYVDLTSTDYEYLDPTGKARTWIEQLKSHIESKPASPSRFFRISPDEMEERYWKLVNALQMDSRYVDFNQGLAKAYGPQGGEIAFTVLRDILLQYYEDEFTAQRPIHDVIKRGRDFLIRIISDLMRKYGGPSYVSTSPVYNTHGGLPTCSKKGTWDCETVGKQKWPILFPALPGTRYMRGKPRSIFMDATSNVRLVEGILSSCKKWLVKYLPDLFSGWCNPYNARNQIIHYGLIRRYASVETDYKGMDIRFRRQVAIEIVLPIYEQLIPDCFLTLAGYVTECYEQPLFMGDCLWTGEHTLFSGIGITSDFETIYSVCLVLGCLLDLGIKKGHILAMGDDLTALVPADTARPLFNAIIEASTSSGLVIHPEGEKSNIRYDSVTFCREYYSLSNAKQHGVIMGYYPSILCVNSVIQPERPHEREGTEFAAVLQRLDNIQWNPEFIPVVQLIKRFSSFNWLQEPQTPPITWWERVYGERWNPAASPTWLSVQTGTRVRADITPLQFQPKSFRDI